MQVASGTRLGVYEVVGLLGVGGMGEVYRAKDLKLHREVALKVLPESFAMDAERLARFQREARVLASLNHPNIASIYGFEDTDGTGALVLELVEGRTLAARIAEGPMPLEEALPIAKQIAEALEAAHEQGIIHRDLKPGNIKVRADGTVKVLDFGLAKVLGPTASGDQTNALSTPFQNLSTSPTVASPVALSNVGMLLGTAAYMSPEQAKGRVADRRADIWAFGCVLFEMLAGQPAFSGADTSDVLVAVLRGEPSWDALPTTTPPSLQRLLRRTLIKDLRQRLQHMGDARIEIEAPSETVVPARSTLSRWQTVSVIAGGVAVASLMLLGWQVTRRSDASPPLVTKFVVDAPGVNLSGSSGVSLSPDGKLLAFVIETPRSIHIRRLASFESYAVGGTQNGVGPFFSPDSRWLGFFAEGKLKRVSVEGGLPATVCSLDRGGVEISTGAWLDDGTIVFSHGGALHRVSADGGTSTRLNTQSSDPQLFDPVTIPGRQAVLARKGALGTSRQEIVVVPLGDGGDRVLTSGLSPMLDPSGAMLFVNDGILWRVGFDRDRLTLYGTPVPLLEHVAVSPTRRAMFSISKTGTLAYAPGAGAAASMLVWLDRTGLETPVVQETGAYASPRVAPDGRRIAVAVQGDNGGSIWIIDLDRRTRIPLTTGGGYARPTWSPDGLTVTFQAGTDIHFAPATGGPATPLLVAPGQQFPDTWTPDGTTLIYNEGGPAETRDIWMMRRGEAPRPLLATSFGERAATVATDRQHMAFVSTDAGRDDVYVIPFDSPGARVPISPAGGRQPVWSRDGTELFFRQDDWMMSAPVQSKPFRIGSPRQLFRFDRRIYGDNANVRNYDVGPDGRFLAVRQPNDGQNEIRVIVNWTEEVKDAAGGNR